MLLNSFKNEVTIPDILTMSQYIQPLLCAIYSFLTTSTEVLVNTTKSKTTILPFFVVVQTKTKQLLAL